MTTQTSPPSTATGPWWQEVTRYQWLVLAIASTGWVFDVFEGQIFGACMNEALPALLRGTGLEHLRETFINIGLAAFMAGGALGGVLFGMMADRWGRQRTMAFTILMYSLFTGLTALAQNWWELAILRFLVGIGVGGEWAVAAAVVAEVFPLRARPVASGIFHASSVLGTYLAVAAGLFVVASNRDTGWRYGFLLGVLPALLVFWVRVSMKDPQAWQEAQQRAAKDSSQRLGRLRDLFADNVIRRHTFLGTALAIIGLATFWGTHFRGKDLLRQAREREQLPRFLALLGGSPLGNSLAGLPWIPLVQSIELQKEDKRSEMLGMFLATTGGGIGLLAFAPISQWLGRRPAFLLFHLGGFVLVTTVYLLAGDSAALLIILPVFGFFTLGMHAGYAVYFPELFSTRLRGTGAGFCFNMARVIVVPVLLGFAWLQNGPFHLSLAQAILAMGCLFLVGACLLPFAPETRGKPLPA